MSAIEKWLERLKQAEKTCLVQDGSCKNYNSGLMRRLKFYKLVKNTIY